MRLTVFLITRKRPHLFARCAHSVLSQLEEGMELRVLVNGPNRATERWLESRNHPHLHWRVQEEEHRTVCRNRAFMESRGEFIYFLDDDVVLPSGGLNRILRRFEEDGDLVVLGGPNLTPPDSSWKQRVFGAVMTSPVAAPMVRVRYGEGGDSPRRVTEKELILCNLAVRRRAIPRWLRFPGHYVSNEENVFLYYCKSERMKLGYDPACYVYHSRRPHLNSFLRQIFCYGGGRAQQTVAAPRSLHPLFLAPALMAIGVLVLGVAHPVLLAPLGLLYLGAGTAGAWMSRECRALGGAGILAVGALTPLVHLAYGLGFWRGTLRALFGMADAQHVRPPVVPAHQSFGIR